MSKKVRIIGDVHGKFKQYEKIISGAEESIQLGDLGIGFMQRNLDGELVTTANPPHAKMVKHNARFIRGNHSNPYYCRKHSQWIPDGTVEGDIMYIGGATSIDKAWRVEGESWWPDEEVSYNDLQTMIDTYMFVKPRIMFTHETPQSIADAILSATNKTKIDDPSRTRQAFQVMLENHRPEIWCHGHWHVDIDQVIGGTRFICLNELSWIDLDI